MRWPAIVAPSSDPPTKSLGVRLMWMAIIWAGGVSCVLIVSLILRGVLHR